MNKKLLAVAVASTFAIPGVVAADASFYGAVKPRVNVQDSEPVDVRRWFADWLEVQYGHGQWQHSLRQD